LGGPAGLGPRLGTDRQRAVPGDGRQTDRTRPARRADAKPKRRSCGARRDATMRAATAPGPHAWGSFVWQRLAWRSRGTQRVVRESRHAGNAMGFLGNAIICHMRSRQQNIDGGLHISKPAVYYGVQPFRPMNNRGRSAGVERRTRGSGRRAIASVPLDRAFEHADRLPSSHDRRRAFDGRSRYRKALCWRLTLAGCRTVGRPHESRRPAVPDRHF